MKIYHYSVGRSGCTFISQLLANIFGLENLNSGHSGYKVDDDLPVVITLRDFKDVVLSFWRVHNNISLKDLELGKRACFEEIKPELNMVKKSIDQHLNPTFENNNKVLLLRYEDFFPDNFDYIFGQFEDFFDIQISKQMKKKLIQNYSFQRNKYKASKMTSFKQYDKEYIHGLHLYKGKIGGWTDLLNPKDHAELELALKKENDKWGY